MNKLLTAAAVSSLVLSVGCGPAGDTPTPTPADNTCGSVLLNACSWAIPVPISEVLALNPSFIPLKIHIGDKDNIVTYKQVCLTDFSTIGWMVQNSPEEGLIPE